MDLIKEFCPAPCANGGMALLSARSFSDTIDHLLALTAAAQQDFPQLTPAEIRVVAYNREALRQVFGIMFHVSDTATVPAAYEEIREWKLP
jgi:hypothetical protein